MKVLFCVHIFIFISKVGVSFIDLLFFFAFAWLALLLWFWVFFCCLSIATAKCPKFKFQNLCDDTCSNMLFLILFLRSHACACHKTFQGMQLHLFIQHVLAHVFSFFAKKTNDNDMDCLFSIANFCRFQLKFVLRVLQCHGIISRKSLFIFYLFRAYLSNVLRYESAFKCREKLQKQLKNKKKIT